MKRIFHIAIIVLACIAVYANSLAVPFQWDGLYYIMENPAVRDISLFFSPSGLEVTDFAHPVKGRWIGYLTFALNYLVDGFHVVGYHAVNLGIHTINTLLVYALTILLFSSPALRATRLTRSQSIIALLTALLFATHPLQTEAVTYIFQRLASLVTMFYLGSVVLYMKARLAPSTSQRRGMLFLSILAAVLAMKTKENAFTLPFVLLLTEATFFAGPWRKRIAGLVPFVLTLLIIPLSLTGMDRPLGEIIANIGPSTRGISELTRGEYLLTQLPVLIQYLRLLAVPVGQNLNHFVDIETSLLSVRVFASLLVLSSMFVLGVFCLMRARTDMDSGHLRIVFFGIFWFFLTISVESSVVPIPMLMAEYRMYLPSIGLILAVLAGMFHLVRSPRASRYMITTFMIAVLLYGSATVARNTIWRDGTVLWTDVVRKNPLSAIGHNNLGLLLMKNGENNQAMGHYQTAISIIPGYADPYNNMGIAYGNLGRPEIAIEFYQEAVALDSDLYSAYNNMGNAYRDLGLMKKAVANYRTALALNPAYAEAHNNLGAALARMGKTDQSRGHLMQAIALKPEFTEARFNLGVLYLQIGDPDAARREIETVLRQSPDDVEAKELLKLLSTDSK